MTRTVLTEKLGKFDIFFGDPAPKTEVGVHITRRMNIPQEGHQEIIFTYGSEHSNI